MRRQDYTIDMLHGPLSGKLLLFALPLMASSLLQLLFNAADVVVVGRFVGKEALAAVGSTSSLINLMVNLFVGLSVGANVVVARELGAGRKEDVRRGVHTAMTLAGLGGIVLLILGSTLARQLLALMSSPEDVIDLASLYLRIYFLGLPFLFMYNILSSMFNALGKSKIPLYLLIFSSVFNMVLDVVLVRELGMGVAGVAWATLIAQGISAAFSFLLFLREMRRYEGDGGAGLFDQGEFTGMARIALPSILQQSTVSIGMMLVQSVVNSFGAEMLAGFSAGMRVESICVVPMAAMGNVMSAYTAQNIGAGREDRIRQGYRTGYGIVFSFAALLCLWLETSYGPLIRLFLGEEGSQLAFQTGTAYLRFIGWFFVLIGLKMITDGVLRGAGDMTVFTIANLVNLGIRVIIAVTCAPRWGIAFVWIAVPIGWLANYVISYGEYRNSSDRSARSRPLGHPPR